MKHRARSSWTTAWLTLAIVSTVLGSMTIARNREYRSGVTLAEVTFDRYPTPYAQHALAENLIAAGRRDEAMPLLWAAVPHAPRAHYTLGLELFNEGRLDEAIVQLQAFIAKQPRLVWVIQAYGVLGQAYEAQSNWPAAIDAFEHVLLLSPGNSKAERALADALVEAGVAHGSTGHLAEAVALLRQAVSVNPQLGAAHYNLAFALCQQGAIAEALTHARQAEALQPDHDDSQMLLEHLLTLQARRVEGPSCLTS
jgi:tetratricopeptide (TPR) repeat protein